MFSVMATSVGSRSMLEAPKNPTPPTCWSGPTASSGSAIGPPLPQYEYLRVHLVGGVGQGLGPFDRLVGVSAVEAPIEPLVVKPTCDTSTSAPALVMAVAWSRSNT